MKNLIVLFVGVVISLTIHSQDITVSFPSDNLTLNGTLSVPSGSGPFPIVILVHGSGPNDRDQTLHLTGGNAQCLLPGIYNDTIRNFKDLASSFQSQGMAVLRYDKRTFTYPTQIDPQQVSPHDFILDIHSAIDFVKTRPEIDTNCIILLGHSQGANLTPIVCAQRNDISKILSLGSASSGIDTILAKQLRDLYYYCLNDTVTGDAIYNQTLSDFQQIRIGTWNQNTPYLGAYPKFWRDWIDLTDSAIINYNAISQPVLFLHGMEDFNIPLEDAQRYESQLTNGTSTVYYLDGINHYFTTGTDPNVAQVVTDTIFHWLGQNPCSPNSISPIENQTNTFEVKNSSSSIIITNNLNKPLSDVQIFDSVGRLIYTHKANSQNFVEVNKQKFNSGVYIITGIVDEQTISIKIMIE